MRYPKLIFPIVTSLLFVALLTYGYAVVLNEFASLEDAVEYRQSPHTAIAMEREELIRAIRAERQRYIAEHNH